MPTAKQPLKQKGPHASNGDRVEMLRLAIEGESAWRVCTLEVDRGGMSYTIDTLRQLREGLPNAELYFLIGSDALRDIARWKEPHEIFRLATPLVVQRAGAEPPDLAALAPLCTLATQPKLIELPAVDVSSSDVRARLAAGESLDGLTPSSVVEYIGAKQLYR